MRKIKNGDTVNICGVPHKILLLEENFTAGDTHFGEIEYTKAEIRINATLPDALLWQTLCHEWLHGALVIQGHPDQAQDEQLVQALASAMAQTFQLKEADHNA